MKQLQDVAIGSTYYIWQFSTFESVFGKLESVCSSDKELEYPISSACHFQNSEGQTTAFLHAGLGKLNQAEILEKKGTLYVGLLQDSQQYLIFDASWEDWERACVVSEDHLTVALSKINLANSPYNTIETWALQDFICGYSEIIFSQASFPTFKEEEPAILLRGKKKPEICLLNIHELTLVQFIQYFDILQVQQKQGGFYVLRGDLPQSFWDARERQKEQERRERESQVVWAARHNRTHGLYDFSGDDLSIMNNMW